MQSNVAACVHILFICEPTLTGLEYQCQSNKRQIESMMVPFYCSNISCDSHSGSESANLCKDGSLETVFTTQLRLNFLTSLTQVHYSLL